MVCPTKRLDQIRKERMNIKDIVKDNHVLFDHYRKGNLFYRVDFEGLTYEFPVPIEDTGDADFRWRDKAILFMRYIRKAIDKGEFVRV